MKQINFIKTVPPQCHLALKQWIIFSTALFILSVSIMGWLTAQQIWIIDTLKQEKNALTKHTLNHATADERKKKVMESKKEYEKKAHKITTHLHRPKNPHTLIQSLNQACAKNNVTLESVTIQKHQLSMRGLCTQPDHALSLIHDLNELPILTNSTLISIEKKAIDRGTQKSALMCAITSDIKK
ncbi:MAG: hypothetical protein NT124_05120 [Candidatus Dependentiae bacterium]|nr:hypothetical protein [Candidatus Dependentiae bacterium]